MAPLFSKIDSNKLWHDVQHEENVIYAQFGKDLFNISKVIGRKKVAQFFFDSQCSAICKLSVCQMSKRLVELLSLLDSSIVLVFFDVNIVKEFHLDHS